MNKVDWERLNDLRIVGMWSSETRGFGELVMRLLASMGSQLAEDMGYESFEIGWLELHMIQEMLNAIDNLHDADDMVRILLREDEYYEHVCNECSYPFDTRRELRDHEKEEHPHFFCNHCGEGFAYDGELVDHEQDEHAEWECDDCDEAFTYDFQLINHQEIAHPELSQLLAERKNENAKPEA